MNYRILTTIEDISNIKIDWIRLLDSCDYKTPFQTYSWCINYLVIRNIKPYIVLGYDNKQLVAIMPLCKMDGTVTFIGDKFIDYGSIICKESQKYCNHMLLHLINTKNVRLSLQNISIKNPNYMLLKKIALKSKKAIFTKSIPTCAIDLTNHDTYDDYLMSLSGNIRRDINSLKRKKLDLYQNRTIDKQLILETMNLLHLRDTSRNSGQDRSDIFKVLQKMQSDGLVDVTTLKEDGELISFSYVFDYGNTIWQYQSVHNPKPKYKNYSAGRYLLSLDIKKAYNSKYATCDLMRGTYDYKLRFGAQIYDNLTIDIYPSSISKYIAILKIWLYKNVSIVKSLVDNKYTTGNNR